MYSIDYQVTHDIDYFFVLNDFPTHIASNGGVMPNKLGSIAFIQETQNKAFSLPMQFSYKLNEDYLSQLNAEDFPSISDLEDTGFLQSEHYIQFHDNADMPHHWKLYSYSFVEMARRGFWSFDRLTDYTVKDLYNTKNLSSVYQLVAFPVISMHSGKQFSKVGHIFEGDCHRFYLGKEKWDFAGLISSSKRIDIVQTERGHYTSPRRLPKIYR